MMVGLKYYERKKQNKQLEKKLSKGINIPNIRDKKYALYNDYKLSMRKNLKQKNLKIDEEAKKNIFSYKNKISSKSAKMGRENIKNENFLVDKIIKYKNISAKKNIKKIAFYRLQKNKRVYIKNFPKPRKFSNFGKFCLKKKKKN